MNNIFPGADMVLTLSLHCIHQAAEELGKCLATRCHLDQQCIFPSLRVDQYFSDNAIRPGISKISALTAENFI